MSDILWSGGEDIDYPNGTAATIITTTGYFRAGYARCSICSSSSGGVIKSTLFPGGAVSSCWTTFRGITGGGLFERQGIGLLNSTAGKGILVACDSTDKLKLWKFDGATLTVLASETGNSFTATTLKKVDFQVVGWGASATVTIYLDRVLLLTFTGDISFGGTVTGVDSVWARSGNDRMYVSEIVVASVDTRPLCLLTMAPSGAGTTDSWDNPAAANISDITIDDNTLIFTNTTGQHEQYNLIDEPSGTFVVKGVKIAARALCTSGATANVLKLGFNSGGSVAVAASVSPTISFATYDAYFDTNPVTSAAWGDSTEMNALQLELQS